MERLKGYIDFDGVILDTETGLFKQYHNLIDKGIEITKEQYLAEMDWNFWIEQSGIINNSIEILKEHSSKVASILTTIHSFDEGKAKIEYLRKCGVKNDIILVPYICRKYEVVNPKARFLVDNYGRNLEGWQINGGKSIRFSVNTEKIYTDYVVISSLEDAFKMFND